MRLATLSLCFVLCLAGTALAAEKPADAVKHTSLDKYATSMEAYLAYRANPKDVHILDARTPEEYEFVGHADMAVNIPVRLWSGKFDPEKKTYALTENPHFIEAVKKRFPKTDTHLYVMCRSGGRSAMAVNALAKAGYTNVTNIVDGFEGDKVTDPDSVFKGKPMKNGWRNTGLPWTYALDPEKVYLQAN